jgi:hypothetical protein
VECPKFCFSHEIGLNPGELFVLRATMKQSVERVDGPSIYELVTCGKEFLSQKATFVTKSGFNKSPKKMISKKPKPQQVLHSSRKHRNGPESSVTLQCVVDE